MNISKRSGHLKGNNLRGHRRRFEQLEDRRLMAVVTGQSTFSASLMGNNIELMSAGNAVGYGYAISYDGNPLAAVGGDGQSRTAADLPERSFNSLTEMDISSVSKTVTATAILHLLQSQPGGLDAALSTPLASYLPSDWTPGENVQYVTLRHLLTHTSGFSESNNPIDVDFNSPSNATYVNLRNLVQADLGAPTVGFDDDYHGPRWGGSYNNANFALLARVVLPKLVNPAVNLTAANYADRDLTSGTMYKQYVQDEIFEPLGVVGADLDVTDPNPTLGYFLGSEDSPGEAPVDRTRTGGAGGWKLSARELAKFLDGIQRDNGILSASTRQLRDEQELGWYQTENSFGESFSHNGANGGDSGFFRSQIVAMPADVEVGYLMNSGWASLPGGNIFNMLQTAYVNAWTDLTVSGTSGPDEFVILLDNSGFQPAIEVKLNDEIVFTHWISTLDSLTLNGGSGDDTFTIEGWNSSIDLAINGGFGDDSVSVLPGVRNVEAVNGMIFDGGLGADSIDINDQSNPYSNIAYSRLYTVSSGAVTRFAGHPAFPGNPGQFIPVSIGFSGVENLDVTTGGQTDVVSVVSKTSGETRVGTGAGDDTIIVAQSAGNIETVDGLVVDGQSGLDTIRLFDDNKTSADPQATGQYDVDANSVSRYIASLGGVSNGTPDTVEVQFPQVESLELTTTDLVDVIRVHATPSNETTIHGGAGSDILNASPDGKNLELVDDLAFFGDAGIDSIVLNDQNNPYSHPAFSRIYNVTAGGVGRSAAMPGNPFAIPITIDVAYSSVEELTLKTGGQSDVVNVESVPSGGAAVQTGAGNDAVIASPTAANLETVNGLDVDGGLGTDSLNIHDENDPYELPGGGVYTITPATVSRFAEHVLFDNVAVPVEVGFAGVENVSLAAGDQQDEFNVQGLGSAASLVLDGNGGADQFNVPSPTFASINIQGDDAPIFSPGDGLAVNAGGFYAVATVPGLYPTGSGAVTIDATLIQYSGIEQTELQSQIYGGPGDFDSNGVVDGVDLSHATLGWFERFGSDLDGNDFLTWQRYLGTDLRPAERLVALASRAENVGTEKLIALVPDVESVTNGDRRAYSTRGRRPALREALALNPNAISKSHAVASDAYESAFEELAASAELGGDDVEATSAESAWDDAFAEIGIAVGLAV